MCSTMSTQPPLIAYHPCPQPGAAIVSAMTTVNLDDSPVRRMSTSGLGDGAGQLTCSTPVRSSSLETSQLSLSPMAFSPLPDSSALINSVDSQNAPTTIPIIGYEIMEERARFTVYKLRVENPVTSESWMVLRRYTDFVRLHAKLREEFSSTKLPLPPKRWLRDNFETSFLEDRLQALQRLVDAIIQKPQLRQSNLVKEFFCLEEPPLCAADNLEESRVLLEIVEDSVLQLQRQVRERDEKIKELTQAVNLLRRQQDRCSNCSRITTNGHVTDS